MEDPRIISALFIFLKMAYYNVLINNIAFISEEVWRAVMTEDISETIRIMKKFNMDDKQRRRFNRLRENYGLLPIKKR